MRSTVRFASLGAFALGAVLLAPALSAQSQRPTQSVASVTPYAGYMINGSFVTGPLGSRIAAANGAVYGGQLELAMSPNVSLVGNLGYTRGDLVAGVPILGDQSIGTSALWMYDGGLQLRLPAGLLASSAIVPFVQGGAGAMRYDVSVAGVHAVATNFAWNAGAGADLALAPGIGLRFMAKDYIGKFDVQQATSLPIDGKQSQHWALSAGLKLGF